jgi:hypothetical protein
MSLNFGSLLLVHGGFVAMEIKAEVVLFLAVELEYLLPLFLKAEFRVEPPLSSFGAAR